MPKLPTGVELKRKGFKPLWSHIDSGEVAYIGKKIINKGYKANMTISSRGGYTNFTLWAEKKFLKDYPKKKMETFLWGK